MKLGPYRIEFRPGALVVPAIFFSYGLYQYLNVRNLPDRKTNLILIEPVFVLMIIFTVWIICQNIRVKRVEDQGSVEPRARFRPDKWADIKKYGLFVLLTTLYLGLIPYVGFIICNLIFLPACMLLLGVTQVKLLLALPAGATLGVYLLFQLWMQVPVPQGVLSFLP
jgi:hypothetical protein